MKKLLQLLERYCQWAALAIGALFLFYMVWSYIFVNPAAMPLGGGGVNDTATPSTVDRMIAEGSAATLEEDIHKDNSEVRIPAPTNQLVDIGAPTTQPSAPVAGAWDSWQMDIDKLVSAAGSNQGAQLVQSLPTVPALAYLDQEPLRTVLATTDASGSPSKQDADAVTTFWAVPMKPLADSFQEAFGNKLSASQQTVLFAHADLVRQQQQGNGEWGPEVVVARVFNSPPPPAYPDAKNPQFAQQASLYEQWLQLAKSQNSIVAADFPAVEYSNNPELIWRPLDAWVIFRTDQENQANKPASTVTAPATMPAQQATGNNPFGTPTTPGPENSGPFGAPTGGNPSTNRPQGGGPGGAGGGPGGQGGRRGGRGGPRGNQNGQTPGQAPQQVTPAPQPKPVAPPAPVAAAPQEAAPPPAPVAVPVLPKLQPVPPTAFSPAALIGNGDMELYFHDLTVEPGQTYRYKVRYSVLNPVFGHADEVDKRKPELATTLSIDSPDGPWSDAVVVEPRTRFWCAAKQPQGHSRLNTVSFTVYSWHDGTWQNQPFMAAPGDEIGDGQFLTHWTLLDVQPVRSTRSVLLVPDNGGTAEQRNEQTDATSPSLLKFQAQVAAQASPQGGTTPAAQAAAPAPTQGNGIAPAGQTASPPNAQPAPGPSQNQPTGTNHEAPF